MSTIAHKPVMSEDAWRAKHAGHEVLPFEVLRPGVYQSGLYCQTCNARLYCYAGPRQPEKTP